MSVANPKTGIFVMNLSNVQLGAAWQTAFVSYQQALSVAGKSQHTIMAYLSDVMQLAMQDPNIQPTAIRTPYLRRYLSLRIQQGHAAKSLRRQVSAWRHFFDHLISQQQMTHQPCEGLKTPRLPKRIPKALGVDVTQHLLNHRPTHGREVLLLRDKAMFEVLYGCGLRAQELLNLTWQQVDLSNQWLTVIGKGARMRQTPIGQQALHALHAWLAARLCLHPSTDHVFVSQQGLPLSRTQLATRLKQWSTDAQLATPMHPHMFRHSYASHLLQSSGDLRGVQTLLGHQSIQSTQVYTRLDYQHLARVIDRFHPRTDPRLRPKISDD
jgi:integrase/recombinase XerC